VGGLDASAGAVVCSGFSAMTSGIMGVTCPYPCSCKPLARMGTTTVWVDNSHDTTLYNIMDGDGR
jgi:hypothetical protein